MINVRSITWARVFSTYFHYCNNICLSSECSTVKALLTIYEFLAYSGISTYKIFEIGAVDRAIFCFEIRETFEILAT